MTATDLTLGAGAVWGAAWALADSKISLPARKALAARFGESWLLALIECPACTSFWLGLLYSVFVVHLLAPLCYAFAFFTMGLSFVLASWTGVGASAPSLPEPPAHE